VLAVRRLWQILILFIELVSPSEDEEEEEEGVRRSRRARIAPVKYWLGEKLEYETWQAGSNRQVPTILGVRRVPEAPAASLSRQKKKGKQKSRSKSRRLATEEPTRPQSVVRVETGWDDDTVPSAFVLDFDTNEEVERSESVLLASCGI
jgi:centromere protein C